MTEIEWERRRLDELSSQYLGRVLDWVGGLEDMPRRAREGHFDDYFCPPEVDDGMNMIRLIKELDHRSHRTTRISRLRINNVIKAVKDGEFDGTKEESERWAASKDGQETFQQLLKSRNPT